MKLFCTVFVLTVSLVLVVGMIFLAQYLSIYGPDWLVAANQKIGPHGDTGNPLLVIACIISSCVLAGTTFFVITQIWEE